MEDKGRGRATNPLEDDASADQSQEVMKEGITTLVGAALGEQQCWERTACKAGEYAATIPGKNALVYEDASSQYFLSWERTACKAGKYAATIPG